MDIFTLSGVLGLALYLGAYGSLLMGWISAENYRFAALNVLAAGLVLLAVFAHLQPGWAALPILWIAFSVAGLVRLWQINQLLEFTDFERDFLRNKLHDLSPREARRLLDEGRWLEGWRGQEMAQQGQEIGKLYYLSRGEADIIVDGAPVARIGPGSFIGELTVLGGGPANASVILSRPSTYFEIPADRLRNLAAAKTELRGQLQRSLLDDTQAKLVRTNATLVETRHEDRQASVG